jgi:ATP-binding cassette subfamily B protein
VLPAVFAVLVGVLAGQLPGAVGGAFASPAWHRAVAALAAIGATLLLIELASSAREIVSTDLYRRFDGHLLGRAMAAALARQDLRLFDDPALATLLDRGVQLARFGPGELVSGLSAQWTVRSQGLAAALLVGYYQPAAAVVLTVVWLVVARAMQASYYRADPFWTDPLRRARYIQRIGLLPAYAKEVRVFGLAGWLVDQYGLQWTAVMNQLWRARRADRRQMAVLGAIVLAAHLAVLALLARSASSGALLVPALIVILQGVLGMAMIASLQGDTWIENGSVPVPDLLNLERAVAAAEAPRHRRAGLPPAAALASGRLAAGSSATGHSAAGLPRQEIRFRDLSFSYPGSDRPVLDRLDLRLQAGRFRDLSFSYPGSDRPVLDRLDLRLQAGRSVAIVGLNGSGKTTLVKLLAGLCRPAGGSIIVDGIQLDALEMTSWRRQLAVIFQDFVRYELSLADNIRFGGVDAPDLSVAAMTEIAAQAGATGLITELPAGLATTLSARFHGGADISGGQWQRVAFARALVAVRSGARVLVMDEPTAHLDVRAEADFYARFLELTSGLTTIVSSHRFSTVRRADRIVVLADGRITEDGSHDELVAAGGQYARMFRLQAQSYHASRDD